jgi:hypothetical protein
MVISLHVRLYKMWGVNVIKKPQLVVEEITPIKKVLR